jgi:hypothetical protein
VKALLAKKGWIKTPMMQAPLHHEDFKDVATLVEINAEVEAWFEKEKSV